MEMTRIEVLRADVAFTHLQTNNVACDFQAASNVYSQAALIISSSLLSSEIFRQFSKSRTGARMLPLR